MTLNHFNKFILEGKKFLNLLKKEKLTDFCMEYTHYKQYLILPFINTHLIVYKYVEILLEEFKDLRQ